MNLRPSGYEPMRADFPKYIKINNLRRKPLNSQTFQPCIQRHSRFFAGKTGLKHPFAR